MSIMSDEKCAKEISIIIVITFIVITELCDSNIHRGACVELASQDLPETALFEEVLE